MLVAATQARRVLEVGVFSGYSVTAMADVLPANGCFTTCTINPHHADDVAADVADGPYADRVDIRVGRAIETMKTLDGPFDLIFLGANKRGSPEYYEASLELLSPGGVIVVDNSFRFGTMSRDSLLPRPTWTFEQLADRLACDYRVICVHVPVREGITLIVRR
jgi:caffeoyl-CoA O-methyltransferase